MASCRTCGLGGSLCRVKLQTAAAPIAMPKVADRVWLVSFMDYDLGYFDDETCRLEPIDNSFGPKVLPMSPEWTL